MSAYLICLTVGGGVPLFTRKRGDLKPVSRKSILWFSKRPLNMPFQIPFPILASLNGVAMFGMSHDVTLVSASTTDCRVGPILVRCQSKHEHVCWFQIVWRDYHGSIRLIIAVPDDTLSEVHVHRLLDLIFQTLVLVVGLDELIAQRNIDRTKRDLRVSNAVWLSKREFIIISAYFSAALASLIVSCHHSAQMNLCPRSVIWLVPPTVLHFQNPITFRCLVTMTDLTLTWKTFKSFARISWKRSSRLWIQLMDVSLLKAEWPQLQRIGGICIRMKLSSWLSTPWSMPKQPWKILQSSSPSRAQQWEDYFLISSTYESISVYNFRFHFDMW